MEGWQYKAAFVIQFQPETEVEAGRFAGRVEHISSSKAIRFQSLDALLGFIAKTLTETSKPDTHNPGKPARTGPTGSGATD